MLWVATYIGLAVHVRNFASDQESFGTLVRVILLLMQLWLSICVILLGARLVAEIEAQTAADATIGPDKAMGSPEARKADMVMEQHCIRPGAHVRRTCGPSDQGPIPAGTKGPK